MAAKVAVTNKNRTCKNMNVVLHYLTSNEMVRVNRRSEMDADDTNVEPASSGNGSIGKVLFVVVLDVVTEGGCVVGGVSVISVDPVATRLLSPGKNSQPNIDL